MRKPGASGDASAGLRSVDASWITGALLTFRINAFDEAGGVGVGPVRMLRFKIGADLFPGVIDRYALTLERERLRADFQIRSVPPPPANHRRERYGRAGCARR